MNGFGFPKTKFDDKNQYQVTSNAYNNLSYQFRQNLNKIIDDIMKTYIENNTTLTEKDVILFRNHLTEKSQKYANIFNKNLKNKLLENADNGNKDYILNSQASIANQETIKETFGHDKISLSISALLMEEFEKIKKELYAKKGEELVIGAIKQQMSVNTYYNPSQNPYSINPQYQNCKYTTENLKIIENQINPIESNNARQNTMEQKELEKRRSGGCCPKECQLI